MSRHERDGKIAAKYLNDSARVRAVFFSRKLLGMEKVAFLVQCICRRRLLLTVGFGDLP